jgi:hypothetical protein
MSIVIKKNLVTLSKPGSRVDNFAVHKNLRENGENSSVMFLNYTSNLAFVPASPQKDPYHQHLLQ